MAAQAVLPCREVTVRNIRRVGFAIYTHEEILQISVKRLTNPVTLDPHGRTLPDGLYDPALGLLPNDRAECETCGLGSSRCPGHFGHIELPVPVYNPLFFKDLYQILKSVCFHCYRLRITRANREAYKKRISLLLVGRVLEACSIDLGGKRRVDEDDEDEGEAAFLQHHAATAGLNSTEIEELQPKVKMMGKHSFLVQPLTAKQVAKNEAMGISLRLYQGKKLAPQITVDGTPDNGQALNLEDMNALSHESKDEQDGVKAYDLNGHETAKPKSLDAISRTAKRKRKGSSVPSQISTDPVLLDTQQVYRIVQQLWAEDHELLDLLYQAQGVHDAGRQAGKHATETRESGAEAAAKGGHAAADMFFVQSVLVAPNKFRPFSVMAEVKYEHTQNVILVKVLKACLDIFDLHGAVQAVRASGGSVPDIVDRYVSLCRALQNHVSQLADATGSENRDGMQGVRQMLEKNEGLFCMNTMAKRVSQLMDSTSSENRDSMQGVRQLLEKKEGLFRMNMMGKRVNFAARSVISPDPYIGTGEIGVPPFFAQRLSFPEPVTVHNIEIMRELVMNGTEVYPGAVAVEDTGKGVVVLLTNKRAAQREAIAKQLLQSGTAQGEAVRWGQNARGKAMRPGHTCKIVYRHLQDGDVLLTNRQPTLHKTSLMAHRARVLHGERTIRMHYANCASFNADFDGDEINLHLPQEQIGRAEGYHIVHADHQFKVPTDGKPVRGLIQDHVVGAVHLTKRDTFLRRDEFLQLVSIACGSAEHGTLAGQKWGSRGGGLHVLEERPVPLPLPAVMKPEPLWTGKQVVNTLLDFHTVGMPPATFSAKAKVTAQEWGPDAIGSECVVAFFRGYFCHGTIDKAQYGSRGLLHAFQELYGGPVVGAITSALSRLLTTYVQHIGFTCGIRDLLLTDSHERLRANALEVAEGIAVTSGAELVGEKLPEASASAPLGSELLRAAEQRVRHALRPRYRQNSSMRTMHDQRCSSALNACASAVTKACFPGGLIRKFQQNCMSLMTTTGAKGGLVNFSQISAMLGQQDLEGRRVPRMASGSTLPSFHAFDAGARSCGFVADRFLTGLRPQEYFFHCMAGRDGLVDTAVKTARSGYLQRCMIKNLEGLKVAYDATVRDDSDGSVVQFAYGEDGLDVLNTSYLDSFDFLQSNLSRLEQDLGVQDALPIMKGQATHENVLAEWKARRKAFRKAHMGSVSHAIRAEQSLELGLPCVAAEYPSSVLGVVSDRFADSLQGFLDAQEDVAQPKTKAFRDAMHLRYMRSLVAAGEGVGVIAGQSIGEPSTQMTLNTFHMAGRGEANVTLGIPRLRELLMAASRVQTPVMVLPLHDGCDAAAAEALAARMRKLRLAECLKGLSVEEAPFGRDVDNPKQQCRCCVIHLRFHELSEYPEEVDLNWQELLDTVEGPFASAVDSVIQKCFRKAAFTAGVEQVAVTEEGKGAGVGSKGDRGGKQGEEGEQAAHSVADINDAGEKEEDENQELNADFTEAKDENRGKELATYETSSEDESSASSSEDGSDSGSDIVPAQKTAQRCDSISEGTDKKAAATTSPAPKRRRADEVEGRCELHILLPLESPKLLMLDIAEAAAVATLVRCVPGINKVFVVDRVGSDAAAKRSALQADGINFEAAWCHPDVVDTNAVTCNDVAAMLDVYGVEAARATLVREVQQVFGAYGIQVDARHLFLIGDFMTYGGGYRPCNRLGIASNASPLLKMSFETSTAFLKDAALRGACDAVTSTAARIVLGQPVMLGTGAVALCTDISEASN